MKTMLLVGIGGALGAMCRFGISMLLPTPSNGFPYATLLINLLGSFILGLIMVKLNSQNLAYNFWAIGICGGFTTFSTYSKESVQLLQNGKTLEAFIYIVVSVLGGITAYWCATLLK
jgi:fluoride exporter